MHIELIRAVQELIPAGSDVVVLGDGEFDGTDWLKTTCAELVEASDHKSRGFNLHKSHLSDPARICLMIATSLAYIWLVYLGEYALEQSWHLLIDRTERRDLSLFQLGMRLLNRLLREGYRLPEFCLAMPGNALNE